MSDPSTPRPGGTRRRIAEPRERSISSTTLLAMVVPVLTVGALALVDPAPTQDAGRQPTSAPLTRSTVVCPPALPGAGEVAATVAGPAEATDGPGALGVLGRDVELDPTPWRVQAVPGGDAVVLRGEDSAAPGLVASRSGSGAAVECASPASELWFTGVGAGAERRSELTLVNPDGGPAVADVTVLGEDGPVEVPALRGLTVRGGRTVSVPLADAVPRRDLLTLGVRVTRGRLAASVVDRYDELGGEAGTVDWLPGRSAPATTDYLLGLGGAGGDRSLVVANPGPDEARVTVRVVTGRSEFVPAGLEELVVPPGSTVVTGLGQAFRGRTGRGAVGLRLDSDRPLTSGLRTVTEGDGSWTVGADPVVSRAATTLAPGPKRLVLAGASRVTAVTVVTRDAQGREVGEERVELAPGQAARTALPGEARSLDLRLDGVPVRAAVESGPPGLAVRPLTELVVEREVPAVRPGLY
jgi:hypothetical protein